MSKTVIVIGAGASGLICAGEAAKRGHNVLLFDKNSKVGRKIMITGKGRCNLTNNCAELSDLMDNIPGNGRFLYSSLSQFMPQDIMAFFENLGVKLKTERGNRVFPESDRAVDVVDALKRFIDSAGVKFINETVKSLIIRDGSVCGVITDDGREWNADAVVIATGGMSYPLTGSTGDGYRMAREAGHTVTKLSPSLSGLICSDGWVSKSAGLTLKNTGLKVVDNEKNKTIYEDFGEVLITHKGVSGPVILSASAHMSDMKDGKYSLLLDLKPALSEEKLDQRLLRDINENGQREIKTVLGGLLPSSMVPVMLSKCSLKGNEKCGEITREIRAKIKSELKGLKLSVRDFCPIEEAIITRGGVSVKEINPKTLESKLVKNLYFTGEIIDVDAYTGGFNLTIAFATGKLAGNSI